MGRGSVVLLANPRAGDCAAPVIARLLLRQATDRGIACSLLIPNSGEATRLAALRAALAGAARVVAVGGDGTFGAVAAGLLAAGRDTALALVPAGRGNDCVRSLGLPRRWQEAAPLLWDGTPRAVDLLRVCWPDGREALCLNALSVGFDAEVAAAVAHNRRSPAVVAYAVGALGGMARLHHWPLRLDVAGQQVNGPVLFVAIANGSYYGGGMRIAPDAAADDGQADIVVAGPVSRLDALRTFPKLYRGDHLQHPLVRHWRSDRIQVAGLAAPVQIDGDPAPPSPLDVVVAPRALAVLTLRDGC